ncbi:nuclease-related domain-containing protein [Bacillus sp. EB01]|uniref:nuclease-related domain-containing protein n=1 Tax=Bacillus sp. EB01 TaxID=1347086 RepID=UPI0009DF4F7C|nr:nuclease-related domain-containing protein [Bacillus sp. EB01]
MIYLQLLKARGVPVKILTLEALLRFLEPNHSVVPKVKQDLKNRRKGYKGEQDADYYTQLLPDEYFVLHDLRLTYKDLIFQIDTLILTTKFFIVVEIKSFSNELYFNGDTGVLTVHFHDTTTGADNPLVQALNHSNQLKEWFASHKFQIPPIEHLAIISSEKASFRCSSGSVARHVGTAKSLPLKVLELAKRYKKEIVTVKEIKKAARLLKKAHSPETIDILKNYGLKKDELLIAVPCTSCKKRPMDRRGVNWHCRWCKAQSKDAHTTVIKDYLLVVKNFISNQECCELLKLPSPHIARRLLQSMDLIAKGKTKGRTYSLP